MEFTRATDYAILAVWQALRQVHGVKSSPAFFILIRHDLPAGLLIDLASLAIDSGAMQ